jgi:hypothetical protein
MDWNPTIAKPYSARKATLPNEHIEFPGPLRVAIAEFVAAADAHRLAVEARLALERAEIEFVRHASRGDLGSAA